MNRYRPTRSTILIVLPYLLLPVGIWLAFWASGQLGPDVEPWWAVRWSLRVVYVGGAFLGWRTGRPRWFYAWLGFAVYEAVATMLQISLNFIAVGDGFVPMFKGLALLPLAFAPYFVTALWLGWQRTQRLLTAYVVFPHAALTMPLALFVDVGALSSSDWPASLLSAAAAAVVAVLFWRPPPVLLHKGENWARAALLFGGVVPAQLLFLIGIRLRDPHAGMETLLLLIPLACLGWLILSGPLLLPALLQWLLRKFKAEMSND